MIIISQTIGKIKTSLWHEIENTNENFAENISCTTLYDLVVVGKQQSRNKNLE